MTWRLIRRDEEGLSVERPGPAPRIMLLSYAAKGLLLRHLIVKTSLPGHHSSDTDVLESVPWKGKPSLFPQNRYTCDEHI